MHLKGALESNNSVSYQANNGRSKSDLFNYEICYFNFQYSMCHISVLFWKNAAVGRSFHINLMNMFFISKFVILLKLTNNFNEGGSPKVECHIQLLD